VAVDGVVLVVMKSEEEGHLSLVVVSVPEDLAVEKTDRDVISMLFELQLNVQESK